MKKNLGLLFVLSLVFFSKVSISAEANCKPVNVAQIDQRIHIQCDNPILDNGKSILWFEVPTNGNNGEPETASRFMSMGMAAIAADKTMRFWFASNDASGSVFGCGENDCRKVTGFFLLK